MRTIEFSGKTSSEALQKVLFELGEDTHVLGTKKKTLNGTTLYVTSAEISKTHPRYNDTFEHPTEEKKSDVENLISTVKNTAVDNTPSKMSDNPPDMSKKLQLDIENLKEQMLTLSSNISNMSHFVLHNKDNQMTTPPEFGAIELTIKRLNFSNSLKDNILKFMIKSVPIQIKRNPAKLESFFVKLLHKMIRTTPEIEPTNNKVVMFCGPTGVGKTTSIAKLSARLMIQYPDIKIGVISLDNYKVGAFKQLEAYTTVLGLPLIAISSPKELIMAITKLKYCNYIVIDTAGTSQYDVEKIAELHDFVFYHSKIKIEKNLVIPANIKYEDAHDILDSFSVVGLDSITITKLDETKRFGEIFSFLFECPIPINYMSMGQTVPDDFLPATSEFIVSKLLESKNPFIKTDKIGRG